MAANFRIVVPARYASTRLPAKPLADIGGKPMIVRVLERVKDAGASETWVATDHEGVRDAVQAAGGAVVMTRPDHPSGTDRLAEVALARGWADEDIVVNVQGDEPLIDPALIDALVAAFDGDETLAMATVKTRIDDEAEQQNPNNVKVVTDQDGYALYFSRSLLPYPRHHLGIPVYKHIGIYAYRRDFLLKFAKLAPTPLERAESLEQLRALEDGMRIDAMIIDHVPRGVDTPPDLDRARAFLTSSAGA